MYEMRNSKNIKIDPKFILAYDFLKYCDYCLQYMLTYADNHNLLNNIVFKSENDKYEYKKIVDNDNIEKYKWLIENG